MKTFKSQVSRHFSEGTNLREMLLKMTSLKVDILQDAALKGAVWVQKGKGKILRERSLECKLSK